jgi:formamidopyrimidine-DNA glycosylase
MPEIPDLEAIRGFLQPRLAGQPVEAVETRVPWLVRSDQKLESLVGHALGPIERRGKFLLLEVDDGRVLALNAMLTGRFQWAEAGERRRPHFAIVLSFAGGQQLRYMDARRMGRWYLVPAEELDAVPQLGELGPDALTLEEEEFLQRLQRHRGQIKPLLTNQRFIAGIGNAYSDEILWEAKLHPHRRRATMDEEDQRRLYRAMRDVFAWAIPHIAKEVATELNQRNEEWRGHLRVHRKAGEQCPRCGAELRGQTRGGSETNYCLSCQPLAV